MGNSSSDIEQDKIGHDYNQILSKFDRVQNQKQSDDSQGHETFYQHKQFPKIQLIERKIISQDEQQFRYYYDNIKFRTDMRHNNICRVLAYKQDTDTGFCSKTFELKILMENPEYTLLNEVQAREIQQNYFDESELYTILYDLVSALIYYQQFDIKHNNIRLDSVYLCKRSDELQGLQKEEEDLGFENQDLYAKLQDPIRYYPYNNYNTMQIDQGQNNQFIYLSPALANSIRYNDINPRNDQYKSDLFTIGMIILHCGLLEDNTNCYSQEDGFDNQILLNKLQKMRNNYSDNFIELLALTLQLEEEDRPSPQRYFDELSSQEYKFRQPQEHIVRHQLMAQNPTNESAYMSRKESEMLSQGCFQRDGEDQGAVNNMKAASIPYNQVTLPDETGDHEIDLAGQGSESQNASPRNIQHQLEQEINEEEKRVYKVGDVTYVIDGRTQTVNYNDKYQISQNELATPQESPNKLSYSQQYMQESESIRSITKREGVTIPINDPRNPYYNEHIQQIQKSRGKMHQIGSGVYRSHQELPQYTEQIISNTTNIKPITQEQFMSNSRLLANQGYTSPQPYNTQNHNIQYTNLSSYQQQPNRSYLQQSVNQNIISQQQYQKEQEQARQLIQSKSANSIIRKEPYIRPQQQQKQDGNNDDDDEPIPLPPQFRKQSGQEQNKQQQQQQSYQQYQPAQSQKITSSYNNTIPETQSYQSSAYIQQNNGSEFRKSGYNQSSQYQPIQYSQSSYSNIRKTQEVSPVTHSYSSYNYAGRNNERQYTYTRPQKPIYELNNINNNVKNNYDNNNQFEKENNGKDEIIGKGRISQRGTLHNNNNNNNSNKNSQQVSYNTSYTSYNRANRQQKDGTNLGASIPINGSFMTKNLTSENQVDIIKKSTYNQSKAQSGYLKGDNVTQNYPDGSKYEGEQQLGLRHGVGKLYLPNGEWYDGSWLQDKRQGRGKQHYKSGNLKYEGEFSNDQFEGVGTLYNESPNYSSTEEPNYKNLSQEQNWDKYEGSFKNGQKSGWGTIYFMRGQRFEGQFSENKANGFGTYFSEMNEPVLKGTWKDDEFVSEF
ncbi:Protein kinase-like domain [Pseudocohnilembus persalinus]|uniref:Protein kinase-like domain n=1 Tax=Pseudocohnilembus persalinus TaxID=266149 RepID=A0A0V0R1T0_PSEPJ|nr:Protein kinase-like domain [Pseudocohnilembus persalinus]|eukprot:KRX08486.1 Protein kinase-like domain [Pseudocohnilembus persalinus]